ncbi:disease resistance NBS-LRR family protein [Salix suchowensis]|nr:disease resistance NBS-LRR family protein [Salix suchowensis]
MAVDIILAFVSPIVEHAIGPINTHICHAFYCKSNLRHLKDEVDKLRNERERLQRLVDEERRKGKVIEDDVAKWILEVDGITEMVERELAQYEDGVKKKCFMGLCPNFKTRYRFGKKAEQKLATVRAKLKKQRSFGSISYHVVPSGVEGMSGKGYQAMQSRIPVFNEIMNALKAADVNIVGVYGMGGVGKTTLVKEVSKQAIEDKLFDKMVIASVARNPDIMKIQGQIADQLGLTFNEESEWGRAGRLRERLKQEKKILVVLDDLWKRLDLEAIGISFKDEQNECKMLLTSRELDVLSSEMEVEKNFPIRDLKEDEAWELFKKTAGGNVDVPDVQSIALKIASKCAGLPLAIVTVAKALKDKSLPEWKDALRELKRPSPRNFTGVQAEVYSAIELSYKHLGNEELKAIFLLCSRMGYNASIHDLLKYSMGSGLFSDVATIEEVRDKVNSLLHKLKTSSLLLDGDTSKQFSIHDVVRDVAISIAFRDHNVFLRSDEVELKWQCEDSVESHEIWLHGNSFGLPEDIQYPLLKVLNMNSEDPSLEVPGNIFRGMQKLKVLGLTNLSFLAPNSSLHFLKNLRSLCLHQSSLGEIAIIGELKKLEILSFVKSNIKHLPKEIGQLTKLKLLDLSDCSELEVISPNVISNLSLLEEFFVGNSFHHWDNEGHNNASLIELEHLSHLTNLDVHMLDSHVMSIDLFSRRLERFRIFIGDVWDWDGAYETLRTLKLKLNESTDHLKYGVLMLLKRTEDLYLLEMKGIKNVISELDSEGFPQLKYLHLHNSPDIQYIIDTMKGVPANIFPFPMLESLFLYNLASLEKIYHGTLNTPSFGKLQMLEVKHCNKLKNLFSFSIARGLLLLQSIKITCCRNLEEIVVEESEEFDNKNEEINLMEFTQVRSLSLKYLPNLRNFCSKQKASCLYQTQSTSRATGMDFGEIILEDEPHTPMQLFDEKFVFPNLEDLKLHSINIERLWHGQLPAITFSIQNLQRLVVKKCGSLKYIFSSSMVKSLAQLKHLAIHDCMSVEEIIVTEALDEEERTSKMLFLKLEHIELSSLPKLKHFCIGSQIECPLLKRLVIDWCHDFQTFVSEFRNDAREVNLEENLECLLQVVFPCLAEIQISHIDKIWHNQLAAGSFCELRSMSISDCDKLVNIFPSILLTRFQRLEMLEISHCHSLETIFELQGLGCEEIQASNAFQLQDLDLYNLPKLKHIWNKDPQGRLIFQNLHAVRVGKCSALKNLFPNLGTFIQGTFLGMSNFKKFGGVGLWQCEVIWIRISYFPRNSKGGQQDQIQQPLFFVEKVISTLEELSLSGENPTTSIIWRCQLPQKYYFAVKLLRLHYFQEESDTIPFGFIQILCNLETLYVTCSSFKRLFSYDGLTDVNQKHRMIMTNWFNFFKILHSRSNSCHSLVSLAPSSASFENLTILDVFCCSGLLNLISSSTAKSLVQLVIRKPHQLLPRKSHLQIPIIEGNRSETMPQDEDFLSRVVSTPKLQGVCFAKNKVCWQGNLNNTIQQLYTEMRWHDQLPFNFCRILANLTVDDCAFVSNAIPSNLLQFMNNLRHLYVRNCDSLEEVFDLEGLNAEEGHAQRLPNLKELQLIDLPRLRDICSRDPQGILDFKNLKWLKIHNCSSLRDLFTPSMASALIITEERVEEAATYRIIFPVLKVIVLESLHSLTSIYSGTGILGIPSLEEIGIDNCPNLKTFISSFLSEHIPISVNNKEQEYRLRERDNDISTAPFLNCKVAFPNMKKLRMEWNDVMEVIQNGQFRAEYFYNLEVLHSRASPVTIDASFKEIVLYEGKEVESHFRAQLKTLELSKLPKLVHLSKEGSRTCNIFHKLETLRVLECGMLKILIPSTLHFQCLTTLEVSNCHGLINLMTSSTAKYLVHLTSMSVTECKMIEEIIASKENEVANEIIFQKLETLRLRCLPSLACFHSGKCASLFHLWKTVLLSEEDDEGCWEEDLNSTVRKLFVEMGDGAAQSELLSIPKQATLTCEAKADGNGPSARYTEDFHFTRTSEARRDISPVVQTIPRTKQNRIRGVY